MSKLISNLIEVRGEKYLVSEIDAGTMKRIRAALKSEDPAAAAEIPPMVAVKCCLDPKLKMADVESMPSFTIGRITEEAYRLTALASEDEKNA